MGKKQKTIIFINFFGFILLSWICPFYIDVSMFNISLDKYCELKKIQKTRNYRLLGKCTHNMDLNFICTNEEILNIGLNNRNDICNNEESVKTQMKQSNGSSPGNTRGHKKYMKNKTCTFETKKYSRIEKKIFKELDYQDFLKNNRTISDKLYKKIIIKKNRLRFALPLLLFLLFSLGLILDFSYNCGLSRGLYKLLSFSLGPSIMGKFHCYLKSAVSSFFKYSVPKNGGSTTDFYITPFFHFIIYCVLFFIFGITLILGIIYYHKKVKKFEKIKFRKR
ncbi:fam-l protein [Plasmodium malariae]|uniref:Fam-l protein n=2 Tax=Plasmodium (Plasmodium) TaxID=418103 RepID=A0A1D3P9W9_PLAMA|nr:fam-l protein [Plasmodium malariae]SCN11986.1 fam-l protein [Plasmodium malariae]